MLYEKPGMEILKIETLDVICASVGTDYYNGDDGNNSNASGSWVQTTN